MSDEVVGIAAANDAAAAAFTSGLQALQAPTPAPAAPAVEAAPVEGAPVDPASVNPLTVDPFAPVAPVAPVEAAPVAPPVPAEAVPDFADAAIVAAGARIGLSPQDIQTLYRNTPAEQRATLLQRLGAAPAPDPEPAPLDPSTLDRELQTYLTSQHPDGARLFGQYREHTERLTALAPEMTAAETALRDAEALVRITSREGVDEMERADAAATHRDAKMRFQELRMEAAERRAERTRLDLEYRALFSNTRSRVLADHESKLAERRATSEREAQIASYSKQWSAETDAAVDSTFSSLGLDPAFKGSRPAAGSQPDLSFWSYVHSALTAATLRGSIQDVGSFISALGPAYAKHVQTINRTQAAAYGRLAQQRSSVPGPAPGVSAVASPEASPSFNGDLRALDELRSTQFVQALRGLPS